MLPDKRPLWLASAVTPYYWSRNLHPREGWRLMKEMGIDGPQLTIDTSQVVTAPYVYDWATRMDKDLELFMTIGGTGFNTILLQPMWAPACMTLENVPAFAEYVYGVCIKDPSESRGWRIANRCRWPREEEAGTEALVGVCGEGKDHQRHFGVFIGGHDTMGSHPFIAEKSWAVPPYAHIDAAQMYYYGVKMARHLIEMCARFGFDIRNILWSIWNELGGPWYWIPVSNPPYPLAFDQFVAEVWIPFMRGVRSVIPDAYFIGPDAESPGSLNFFLDAVKRAGAEYLPNAISAHLYAKGTPFPEGSINEIIRAGGWKEVMERHGYTRVLNTEYSAGSGYDGLHDNGKIVTGTREIVERFPWIVAHAPHPAQFFEGGGAHWDAVVAQREEEKFVPNSLYNDMKVLIAETKRADLPPPPPPPDPPARVLTEFAYRITDMRKCKDAEGMEYHAPQYLFVAVREPKLIIARTEALNITRPFEPNDYMVVAINNDGLVQGDQTFAIYVFHDVGRPYLSGAGVGAKWSELPEAMCAEFGYDTDGKRRRGARS